MCRLLHVLPLILGVLASGCASYYEGDTLTEGARIQEEKLAEVDAFRRNELMDPRASGPISPREVLDFDLPLLLSLDKAIEIATERNRDYKSRRESLFLSALGLGLTRRNFLRPVFDGSVNWDLTDGKGLEPSDITSLSLGGDYLLFTGGTLRVDGGLTMSNDEGLVGPDQSTSGSARVSLSQPLLQGAGNSIAFEGLTQAERSLLYEARDFEQFRQDFVIGIIDDYYALLSQKEQLNNTRDNVERQSFARDQAEAQFRIGRGDSLSVFRAEQSVLQAQNQLVADEQAFSVALDRFKIQLGLPTEVDFEVADSFPEVNELQVDVSTALESALHNRLDLRTERDQVEDQERAVRIAKNDVLPRFDLSASYTTATDAETSLAGLDYNEDEFASIGLSLEIPLDKKAQRNAYRNSLITLDRLRRELDRSEDQVILDVRNSIGVLRQRRTQIELGKREIESLELSLEKATLEFESGLITNRDVTEAADELTDAKNQQLDRIVDHEIARLRLLQQVGLLFVDESGKVDEE